MLKRHPLWNSDPAEGNGTLADTSPVSDSPPPAAPPEDISAPPAAPPPPAATIALAGTKTEEDVAPDLDARKLQTRIAQLEDEKRRLLDAQSVNPQQAQATGQKKTWLEGGSFFD